MILKLVWIVVTITANGQPTRGNIAESTVFESVVACREFGRIMTPRVADFVRGAMNAEWTHPVVVKFRCEPDGTPA